jgi:hypothetical protein
VVTLPHILKLRREQELLRDFRIWTQALNGDVVVDDVANVQCLQYYEHGWIIFWPMGHSISNGALLVVINCFVSHSCSSTGWHQFSDANSSSYSCTFKGTKNCWRKTSNDGAVSLPGNVTIMIKNDTRPHYNGIWSTDMAFVRENVSYSENNYL